MSHAVRASLYAARRRKARPRHCCKLCDEHVSQQSTRGSNVAAHRRAQWFCPALCVWCLPHARLHTAREAVPTDSCSVSPACGGGSYSEGRPAHASRAHAPLPMTWAPPPCKSYSHSGGWPAEGSAKLQRPTVALPRRSARPRATMLGLCARVAQSCTEKHARARAINILARHVVRKASMCTHFFGHCRAPTGPEPGWTNVGGAAAPASNCPRGRPRGPRQL